MRAATKPSPPLLPGPATTTTRAPGGWRVATASATARPACSIRVRPGVPAAIVRRSASAISAGTTSPVMAGQVVAAGRAVAELENRASDALGEQISQPLIDADGCCPTGVQSAYNVCMPYPAGSQRGPGSLPNRLAQHVFRARRRLARTLLTASARRAGQRFGSREARTQ